MKLVCEACQSPIPAEDVDLEIATAKCRRCNSQFSILDGLTRDNTAAKATMAKPPALLPVPQRLETEQLGKNLTIAYDWHGPVSIGAIVFSVLGSLVRYGFLIFLFVYVFGVFGAQGKPSFVWFARILMVLSFVGALRSDYLMIISYFNRTTIRSAGGEVSVQHGPMPWFRNYRIPASDVRQVYCIEQVRRRKRSYRVSYSVIVLCQNGRKIPFLSQVPDMDEAIYIQQKLRENLGLPDEHVEGSIAV